MPPEPTGQEWRNIRRFLWGFCVSFFSTTSFGWGKGMIIYGVIQAPTTIAWVMLDERRDRNEARRKREEYYGQG